MKKNKVKITKTFADGMMLGDNGRLYKIIYTKLCKFNGNGFYVTDIDEIVE